MSEVRQQQKIWSPLLQRAAGGDSNTLWAFGLAELMILYPEGAISVCFYIGLKLVRGGRAGPVTLKAPGADWRHSPSAGHQQRPSACSTWLWPRHTQWWRGHWGHRHWRGDPAGKEGGEGSVLAGHTDRVQGKLTSAWIWHSTGPAASCFTGWLYAWL